MDPPYQVAMPRSTVPGSGRSIVPGRSAAPPPQAVTSSKSSKLARALRANALTCLREGRRAELVAGRSFAELGAERRTVARSGHVAEVRVEDEGVGVLLGVAAARAEVRRGRERGRGLLRRGDVERAGAVADLALHLAELLVVGERRAAGLGPAGHVAADAVAVPLLADGGERLPGLGVRRLLPERDRLLVAVGAVVDAGVARVSGRGRRRLLVLGGGAVGGAHRLVE